MDDGRTEDAYTISLPCDANGSGELKSKTGQTKQFSVDNPYKFIL